VAVVGVGGAVCQFPIRDSVSLLGLAIEHHQTVALDVAGAQDQLLVRIKVCVGSNPNGARGRISRIEGSEEVHTAP